MWLQFTCYAKRWYCEPIMVVQLSPTKLNVQGSNSGWDDYAVKQSKISKFKFGLTGVTTYPL